MAEKKLGSVIGAISAQIVTIVVCLAVGWIAREMTPKAQGPAMPDMAAMMAGMAQTVAVTNVQLRAYNLPERYVAHAEPIQEVDLLPQVDGYVKEILFKEGELIKEGQLLYVLDDERYLAVVNQRKADLAAAEAEERRTKRQLERMLAADARGITQLERDNAEAAWETAKASVLQAKANLVVAEYDLKKAKVLAPISGQIGKTAAHVGDYVAPSKGALARIVQVDPMRVSFPLTDRDYIGWRQAKKSGKAIDFRLRLALPDGSIYDREGEWDFDDNEMSRETATIIMRLKFPNPDRLLVPNSYVTMMTDYKVAPQLPCVPQQAVVDGSAGSQMVYVVKDDMTVEQRVVTTKETFEGWTPLISGVKTGERVIVSGMNKIGPGMKVKIVDASPNDDLTPGYKPPIAE